MFNKASLAGPVLIRQDVKFTKTYSNIFQTFSWCRSLKFSPMESNKDEANKCLDLAAQ